MEAERCDRISDLPDTVIHHIFSFLPIKDIIRTSFLSRRWRYLWTSVPNLDFNGLVFSPKTKFVKFVDSVLLRRDYSRIQKFSLRFDGYYCDTFHAQAWISAAVSHNVGELSIYYYYYKEKYFELPVCLFTCKSITVLKLNLYSSILSLPYSIHLPFLNTLHLTCVTFSDNNLTRKLFSNCPMLKDVILEDCAFGDLSTLHISSKSIERLTIDGLPREMVLHEELCDPKIIISTPRLLSLIYLNYLGQNICLENVSSLVDAALFLSSDWDESKERCSYRMSNFLRDLSNTKVLTIDSTNIQLRPMASILGRLSKFHNLKHLKLTAAITKDKIQVISCLLHSAPNLEFLTIDFFPLRWFKEEKNYEPQNLSFGCVIDHLKYVKIRGFGGSKDELVFVKFILANTRVLKRMTIASSKQLSRNPELQMKISQEILMHPRNSTSNEVLLF